MKKIDTLCKTIIDYIIDNIIITMENLNITQEEIAKEIGTSREIVNRWLNRKQLPRLDLFIKLYIAIDSKLPGIYLKEEFLRDLSYYETDKIATKDFQEYLGEIEQKKHY